VQEEISIMKRTILASMFGLAMFAVQANAQEVSLYAGYLNPGKLDLSAVQSGLSFRGTGIYGARFEFDFHRILGIEQDIAFSPRLFNSSLFPDETGVKGFLYSSNLVLNVPLQRFVPYLTAGVGLLKPFGTGFMPFDVKFAGNYGGGVKFERLIGPMGLRFDVRGYSVPGVLDSTLNIFEASGGLIFSFGRER
jgi:hypothetical protein